MFKAEILADSLSPQGERLTTMKITFPRFILAEMNTHRMFSRNSASSRAIPFKKMVEMVQNNPFIPIAWQKDHKGMQGTKYISDPDDIQFEIDDHLADRDYAVYQATRRNERGITKQLCNRYLEPFMWHTVIVTATEWENFFKLRCPQYEYKGEFFKSKKECIDSYQFDHEESFKKDREHLKSLSNLNWLQINESQADIHIQAIAEMMWDAYDESIPKQLKPNEWHIPYGDKIDESKLLTLVNNEGRGMMSDELNAIHKVKIATARCDRISYETLGDNPKINYEADIRLHDMLAESGHWSPFEHCAKVMNSEEYHSFFNGRLGIIDGSNDGIEILDYVPEKTQGWCRNFRGFIQYRHLIESVKIKK